MKDMGPFAQMVRRQEGAERLISTVRPWTPEALVNLIRIYASSPAAVDVAIAKSLHTLATHRAMQAFWREVSDPVATTSLSMTAAIFAAIGPGGFDGGRLPPKEVDDRCQAVRESIDRLQKALNRTPFLLTNDATLRAKLEGVDVEATERIGSDKVFRRRDRGEAATAPLALQYVRAFLMATAKILRLHGYRNIVRHVITLSTVLLDYEPDKTLARDAIRKERSDVRSK